MLKKTDIPSLAGYALKSDIPSVTGLVKEAVLTDYAKKTDLPKLTPYLKTVDAEAIYAKKADIPKPVDLTDYAKKEDIPQSPDLTPYAKAVDIAKTYETKADADTVYAKKTDIPAQQDLSPYLKTADADEKYATKDSLPDMTLYAKKADVADKQEMKAYIGNAIADAYDKAKSDAKYTLGDMVKGIGGLKAQNLLDPGQSYDTSVDKQNWKAVAGLDVDGWNKLIGKTITVSYDLEWANYQPVANSLNRIGMEWVLKYDSQKDVYIYCWDYPQTSNGKEHVASTLTIPNDKIVALEEGCFYDQLNPECTVKATNFKIVVNPMGGG